MPQTTVGDEQGMNTTVHTMSTLCVSETSGDPSRENTAGASNVLQTSMVGEQGMDRTVHTMSTLCVSETSGEAEPIGGATPWVLKRCCKPRVLMYTRYTQLLAL